MLSFLRFLIGFVEFSFTEGFTEGFLNECLEKGIVISDVKYIKNGITAQCPAFCYARLRPLAKNSGGRLRVKKKKGIVFALLPLRNRWGLFSGALAAVFIICFLTGFVWNIEIKGNSVIPESEIIRLLEENGLEKGAYKRSIDKGRLESLIMAAFPDCSRAHINENGTTLTVEISEGVLQPEVFNEKLYSNLKASKDGVIVKAVVNRGWQAVRKGEAVTKGDILISGVYESEKKKMNLYAHASGEFIARVNEPLRLTVSRRQSRKEYTGEYGYKYLYFFGISVPLFISSCASGDVFQEVSYVALNGKSLPLGIIRKTVKTYTVKTDVLSDKELERLADSELEKKLKADFAECEIVSKKLERELNSDGITVKGTVICLENIGEEVKIIK